jgi:hypothetical protein
MERRTVSLAKARIHYARRSEQTLTHRNELAVDRLSCPQLALRLLTLIEETEGRVQVLE